MKKMDLGWGDGTHSVLLDIKKGCLRRYVGDEVEQIHRDYGGENYYRSRSGWTGAGWIPASPTLRLVGTYRPDICIPQVPNWEYVPETLPGYKILVPVVDKPEEWPAIIQQSDIPLEGPRTYLLPLSLVSLFLTGYDGGLEEREFVFRTIPEPSEEPKQRERVFRAIIHPEYKSMRYRKALVALYHREIRFEISPENLDEMAQNRFWSRLGLHRLNNGNHYYKVANGVCWAAYTQEQLSTSEGLQEASPQNVHFLRPNVYIQESGRDLVAVGVFTFDGQEVEYEIEIDSNDFARAVGPYNSTLFERLETAAREKYEKQVLDARISTMREMSAEEISAMCEEHGDTEITLQDSLAAGNCEPGTRGFSEKYFSGRESVKVSELARFLSVSAVRSVLERKFVSLV